MSQNHMVRLRNKLFYKFFFFKVQAQTFALADGVKQISIMPAEDLPLFRQKVTFTGHFSLFKHSFQSMTIVFTCKTWPCTLFLPGKCCETIFLGNFLHFCFIHLA